VAPFLVFRDLPGVTRDQYSAAQNTAAEAADRTSAADRQVTYRGGFFLPHTGQAICIFDAETAADVTAINTLAGLPVTDVVEVIDLHTPPGQPPDQADATGLRRGTP
jgi:Nickel responsive protein SCO4226-like